MGIGNILVDVLAHTDSEAALRAMRLPVGFMQLIDEWRFEDVSRAAAALRPSRATGGAAANTMLALARLGAHPGLIGKTGDDADGRFHESVCRAAGVDTFFLRSGKATGTALTFILPGGERTFATYLGAAAELAAEDLSDSLFAGYQYLYIEGYLVQNHSLINRAVSIARRLGMKICLDMASYNVVEADLEYFRALVRDFADIVFANEDESRAFTGLEPAAALERIAGLCDIAVVKLGARGAIAARRAAVPGTFEKAARPAGKVSRVTDATAAGDFFAAGFLYALTRDCPLARCLEAGTELAAAVIQVTGTVLPDETWREVQCRIGEICNQSKTT